MANTEINEASEDVDLGDKESSEPVQATQAHILEQVRLGNLDLFRTELDKGKIPLDFKAGRAVHYNRTPLHLAAMEGLDKIVEFILSHKEVSEEVVNAKDCFGYTPLHLAVRDSRKGQDSRNVWESRKNVVRLLTTSSLVLPDRFLAATSESDEHGSYCGGYTPLHWAAVRGHIAIAKLLLRQPCQEESKYNPVNILAMSWLNSTPLDIARLKKFWELANFLEASDLKWLQQESTRTTTSANAVLVGAALVAAAAYGAWLRPTGGMLESESWFRDFFYVSIAFACYSSLASVQFGMLAFSRNPLSFGDDLGVRRRALFIAETFLQMAIFFFMCAFFTNSLLVLHNYKLIRIVLLLPLIHFGVFIITFIKHTKRKRQRATLYYVEKCIG